MVVEIAPRIVLDPRIQEGRPVIKGTRVPVDVVLGHLAAGETYEQVAQAYDLQVDDILAVLKYAAEIVASEVVRART